MAIGQLEEWRNLQRFWRLRLLKTTLNSWHNTPGSAPMAASAAAPQRQSSRHLQQLQMSPIVNRREIHDRIAELVSPLAKNRAALESMTETTSILGDLKVNSARLVDLILAVEDEFGIEVDDDDVDKVTTISDVVELVADKLH